MTKIGGWAGVPGVLNCCWLRCAGGAICEEEVKVFSWPASWLLLPRLWACFWALSEKLPEADSSIESLSMLSKKKKSLCQLQVKLGLATFSMLACWCIWKHRNKWSSKAKLLVFI